MCYNIKDRIKTESHQKILIMEDMKIADTISVNPGKSTLGHRDKASDTIFRSPVVGVEKSHDINLVKVLFPSAGTGSSELRKYSVPMRTVFATILLASGIFMLSMPHFGDSVAFAICTLSFGAFLALGLFTRPVMFAASIFYCIAGALSIRHGVTDMNTFALMFGCLLFCITGSGKYSCDTLLRKGLQHHKINSEKKRREKMMGYKAFHQVI